MQYVYILASCRNGTLYIGTTRNLEERILFHKQKINKGFTCKYNVNKLVYYEEYEMVIEAIYREKRLKKWKREWKIKLIENHNPMWKDLSADWYD